MNALLNRIHAMITTGLIFCLSMALPAAANDPAEREWHFRVYLDDKPIGYHYFRLTQTGDREKLTTRAQFDVTFLKIPLFKYRHDNVERWDSQCLESIASSTDENGKLFRVEGSAKGDGFQVSSNAGDATLPACISTFAYWDKSFLQEDRLLNSQTGEYLDVKVDDLGEQAVMVRDASVTANHYKLVADKLDIELWYSGNDQWLALQSKTAKGRLLRYVIE